MKTRTIVTEITHEDLVNLLSTALYDSTMFDAHYNRDRYRKLPEVINGEAKDDCYEDRLARMLTHRWPVWIHDLNAEDEDEYYGNLMHEYVDGTMQYCVNMEDVVRGLQRCADGTFKANDEQEKTFVSTAFARMMDEEGAEFDQADAEALLQVIVFNELIYG